MWQSRWLCASALLVLSTADARGGMTSSSGGSGWWPAAAWYIGSPSHALRRHGRDLALDCNEERRYLTEVIGSIVGQYAGEDLAGTGIDGEMELASGPARPIMLLLIPVAFNSVRPVLSITRCSGPCGTTWNKLSKSAVAVAECGVVRNAHFLPEQPKHARGEALGLAQGKVKASRGISINSIAASECQAHPSGVARRGACHPATASSSSQRVGSSRRRSPAAWADQF
jgi:hypothetical protein